jgi:hypothetical protein
MLTSVVKARDYEPLLGVAEGPRRLEIETVPGRKRIAEIQRRKKADGSDPENQALSSPRLAMDMMRSAARKASAMMVMVGWPRPEVTKLLPSHRNRFFTSWV